VVRSDHGIFLPASSSNEIARALCGGGMVSEKRSTGAYFFARVLGREPTTVSPFPFSSSFFLSFFLSFFFFFFFYFVFLCSSLMVSVTADLSKKRSTLAKTGKKHNCIASTKKIRKGSEPISIRKRVSTRGSFPPSFCYFHTMNFKSPFSFFFFFFFFFFLEDLRFTVVQSKFMKGKWCGFLCTMTILVHSRPATKAWVDFILPC